MENKVNTRVSPPIRAESIRQRFWQPGEPEVEEGHDPLAAEQRKDGQVRSFQPFVFDQM